MIDTHQGALPMPSEYDLEGIGFTDTCRIRGINYNLSIYTICTNTIIQLCYYFKLIIMNTSIWYFAIYLN